MVGPCLVAASWLTPEGDTADSQCHVVCWNVSHGWLRTRLQQLQCISNGVITLYHQVMHIWLAWHKTVVTPLLTHWSYCSVALSHQQTGWQQSEKQLRFGINKNAPLCIPHRRVSGRSPGEKTNQETLRVWCCRNKGFVGWNTVIEQFEGWGISDSSL